MSCFNCDPWKNNGIDEYTDCGGFFKSATSGTCFFSKKETNHFDVYFEAWLHPDHYHEAWQDYINSVQSNITIEG